jgi:hypothetical protein
MQRNHGAKAGRPQAADFAWKAAGGPGARGARATPAVKNRPRGEAGAPRSDEVLLPTGLLTRATLLSVLLDRRLGEPLVLRANHPENGSRSVLATGDGAQLDGTFAPLAAQRRAVGDRALAAGRPAGAEGGQHRRARARDGIFFYQRG